MQGILDNMETKIFEDEDLDEVDDEKIIRFNIIITYYFAIMN